MNFAEKECLNFMKKFDEIPFQLTMNGETYFIGDGKPCFSITFHNIPKIGELLTSTSIALGEAYMHGDIEIEGDLYDTLCHFLGQIRKFSTDKKALKSSFLLQIQNITRKKKFLLTMISEMIFTKCGLMKL